MYAIRSYYADPLYIIDGVFVNNNSTDVLGTTSVVQNRLSDISPQDIERIEVIRGAAAAAIYGSRITSYNVCYTKLLRLASL